VTNQAYIIFFLVKLPKIKACLRQTLIIALSSVCLGDFSF